MSQHSSSYSYDSLNDVFNIANRKGKMQKKYLSKEYLDAAQALGIPQWVTLS